jgi:hypothetical protein
MQIARQAVPGAFIDSERAREGALRTRERKTLPLTITAFIAG